MLTEQEQAEWRRAINAAGTYTGTVDTDEKHHLDETAIAVRCRVLLAVDAERTDFRRRTDAAEQANRENEALLGAWRLAVGVKPDCPRCHGKGGNWWGDASSCEAWHPCACWTLLQDQQALRLAAERDLANERSRVSMAVRRAEEAETRLVEVVWALMDAVPDAPVAERPVGWVRRLVGRAEVAEHEVFDLHECIQTMKMLHGKDEAVWEQARVEGWAKAEAAEHTLATVQAEHAKQNKAWKARIERVIGRLQGIQYTLDGADVGLDEWGSPCLSENGIKLVCDIAQEAINLLDATPPTGQEPIAICADCGDTLQLVRPGKYQCDNCER